MITFLLFLILAVLVVGGFIHVAAEAISFAIGAVIVIIWCIVQAIKKKG